jgi:hypothetical protein
MQQHKQCGRRSQIGEQSLLQCLIAKQTCRIPSYWQQTLAYQSFE